MNKLLMLTANFPFENVGDSNFIKNEIEELCNNFDQVKILSTAGSNTTNLCSDNKIAEKRCVPIKKFRFIKALKAVLMCFSKQAREEYAYAKQNYANIGGFEIYKKIFKYYYAYYCLINVIAEMSDEDTYIYSYWFSSRAFSAVKAVADGKCKAKKIVSRAHRFDIYKSVGYQPFRSYLLQNIDRIYFVSEAGKADFEKEIASKVQNVKSSFCVYRLGINAPISVVPDMQSAGKIFKIVSCSNVIPIKRLDLIIKALSLLNIDIEWTHYGSGKNFSEVVDMAESELKNNRHINYRFAGHIDNDRLLEIYKNEHIDLFLNVSDSEGVPVSIMEAQQFGIPAMARDVGGNREIVLNELLLPSEVYAKDIAQAIFDYAQKTCEEQIVIRQKSRQIICDRYDSIRNTKRFCDSVKTWE